MMRILFVISSQQKGFFISLARLLAREHTVSVLARDRHVAGLVRRLAPELDAGMEVGEDFRADVPLDKALEMAGETERRFGVRLAYLLGMDRGLGRGYIFNADRYPQIGRADWSHERKLASLLERFALAEHLLDTHRPDAIISIQKDEVLYVAARSRGVLQLSLAPVKLGSRYLWSDNEFITSTGFLAAIRRNLEAGLEALPPAEGYSQEAGSKFNHAKLRFTWKRAAKECLQQAIKDCKALVRGQRKKDSYPFLGWVPYLLRRPYIYRRFLDVGIRPGDLAGRRAVYVPLHLEPEIALLAISPEFNNSMEMIAWISKAAPADVLVVVKEQPYCFGVRSWSYYRQLMQIPNVVLAHPQTTSWEWIQATTVTATITGTAATEAVAFGRPVLSFGRHQAVNLLPTVRMASEYESARQGLDDLLALAPGDPAFEISRRVLHQAQMEATFDLAGFEKTFPGVELEDELAGRALEGLRRFFPAFGVLPDNPQHSEKQE